MSFNICLFPCLTVFASRTLESHVLFTEVNCKTWRFYIYSYINQWPKFMAPSFSESEINNLVIPFFPPVNICIYLCWLSTNLQWCCIWPPCKFQVILTDRRGCFSQGSTKDCLSPRWVTILCYWSWKWIQYDPITETEKWLIKKSLRKAIKWTGIKHNPNLDQVHYLKMVILKSL